MATRRLLGALIARFGDTSRPSVSLESVGGVDAAKRIRAGEAFDIAVLASDVIDALIAEGRLVGGSRVDVAISPVAVAVRAGAPRPDIGSAASVRDAVLAAASVGYSTGPSGTQLARLFAEWRIADALNGRIVIPPPGVPVGTLVARGDVELGFQQLSELKVLDGIEVVGMLPPEIQILTTFSGGITSLSAQPDAAREVLGLLAGPAVAAIKREHGMEPA
jgi:molybdate transport system substrate-binding protein